MQRCYPDHLDEADDDDLAAAYAWPAEVGSRPVLRANMVASIDGGTAVDGKTAGLGSAADQRLFAVLRDLADVLLVGAGTIRAEGYGGIRLGADRLARRRRWGLHDAPPVAVVTGGGGLDRTLGIFSDSETPPIILTTSTGAARMAGFPARIIDTGTRTATGTEIVDLDRTVAALGELGLRRVHCEGGPALLGRLIAAQLLDELCLTTTPLTVGPGHGTLLADVQVSGPVRWTLVSLHFQDDQVFSRYQRVAR